MFTSSGGPIASNKAAIAFAVLFLSAIVSSAAAAQEQAKEIVPPVGEDHIITLPEIRYCLYQDTRVDGARSAIDNTSRLEIDAFNALVEDWNARCSSYRYSPSDQATAEADRVGALLQLKREGEELVATWRSELKASQYHVDASARTQAVNLRSGPGPGHRIVASLNRFEDLIATGPPNNGWLPVVRRRDNAPAISGYVLSKHLRPGLGAAARRLYCASISGPAPRNGEVLEGSRKGPHAVIVENGRSNDAYVKIVGPSRVELAFYVEAHHKTEIVGLPDGSYLIAFVTGNSFSRGCDTSIDGARAQAFDRRRQFAVTDRVIAVTLEITLHPVTGGQARTHEISIEEFVSY